MVHTRSFAAVVNPNSSNPHTDTINPEVNQIDALHSLYLHPSDHPGLLLINQQLNERNYSQWRRAMTIALTAKFKIGLIDGTYTKPDPNSILFPYWERCNSKVISWLLNVVSSEISSSVVYLSTAKQIWDDLATRFTQSHIPRVYQVRKDLVSLTQGKQTLSVYYTKFRALLDELDNLSLIPKCTCECICGNAVLQAKNDNVTKVSQFLMGLNPHFSAVRSQILLIPNLPSLNETYSLLLQEKEQKQCAILHTENNFSDSVALLTKRFGASKIKSKLFCDYCNDTGHTREKCFVLNGYPSWFKGHRVHNTSNSDKNFSQKVATDKQTFSGNYKGKYVPQAAQGSYVSPLAQGSCVQPFQNSSINTNSQVISESSLPDNSSEGFSAGVPSHISSAQYNQIMDILHPNSRSTHNSHGFTAQKSPTSHVAAMTNVFPSTHLSVVGRN